MKSIFIALFVALLGLGFSSGAFAQVLTVQPGSQKIEGVTLAATAKTADNQNLTFVGAGLRTKKVVMVKVQVYVGEFLIGNSAKFQKTAAAALNSVTEAAPVAVRLHFLRDVDADKVQSSFKEALEANKIDLKKPEVQKFLEAVKTGGEAKKGKTLTVLGIKKSDGSETVIYEDANLKATTIAGGPGFIQEIFAIWLGQPADDGVAKLKSEILK